MAKGEENVAVSVFCVPCGQPVRLVLHPSAGPPAVYADLGVSVVPRNWTAKLSITLRGYRLLRDRRRQTKIQSAGRTVRRVNFDLPMRAMEHPQHLTSNVVGHGRPNRQSPRLRCSASRRFGY